MSDIRIKDLPETLDVESDDYVAVDNAGDGTRKYTLRQLIASVGAPEFVVNINASGDADKTLSEITTAIANGYIPVAVYDNEYYQLTKTTATSATFTKYNELGEMVSVIVGDGYTEVREDTLTTNNVFNYSGVPGENVSYALDDLSNNIGYLSDRVNDAWNDVHAMNEDVSDLESRVTVLEAESGGSSGDGLTQTEKELILTLFSKAAYADDDAEAAYDELESLWATTVRTISYRLSHVMSSNATTSVDGGDSYSTVLSAQTNYAINNVNVIMGGEDITSTAYRSGTITVPRVTGNIVITASAVLAAENITATYTQSGDVYTTDSLDSLKADLVVTANYSSGDSDVVTDYTLSGTLTTGTSTITVEYGGLTATFDVTVSSQPGMNWTSGVPYTIDWSEGGYLLNTTTGEVDTSTNANDHVSGYLDCRGASAVVASGSQPYNNTFYFYDANKTFIDKYSAHSVIEDPFPLSIPRNAYYIRIQGRATSTDALPKPIPYLYPTLDESTAYEFDTHYVLSYPEETEAVSSTSNYALCYGATKLQCSMYARSFIDFYDSEKTYLSRATRQNEGTAKDIPEGTYYVRLNPNGLANVNNPWIVLSAE